MRAATRIIALATAMAPTGVVCDEHIWDSLQVHGFASQAIVKTTDNNFFGTSPNVSFDFSEVGINASLKPYPKLLLAGQLLFRRAGNMYENSLSLDYALADLMAFSSEQGRTGVRIGRIKNPLGLYNETRDVPFTRPSILLPQVIYFDKVRNLVLSSDGLAIYGDWFAGVGDISLTLTGGRALIDENVEWSFLGNDWPGNIESDDTLWTGALWFLTGGERVKLGLSGAMSSLQFHPSHGSPLQSGTLDFFYWIASFQYNARDWTISAELSREPLEWRDYGAFFPDQKATSEGYYLQGAYRARTNIEVMLRYEEGFANRYDRDGIAASLRTNGSVPPFSNYSKIWTAGIRWDISRHLMARAEYQRHDGTFVLSNRENPISGDLVREWDLFALQVAVRF